VAKKPKPVCNLLVDDKGDAGFAAPANDPSLDVLSADIASDGKKITGAIRLAGAPSGVDPLAPSGRTYHLEFYGQGGANPVFLSYLVTPTAASGTYGYYDPVTTVNTGIAEATSKVVGNTIYLTAPIGAFAPYGKFKPGSKITGLSVTNGRMVGAYVDSGTYLYNSPVADSAEGGKVYTAGSLSCVKVGG
jgi:hypothetical protein